MEKINDKLKELENAQKNILDLIIMFRDNYQAEEESGMIRKGLSDTSNEVHKMQLRFARGEEIKKSEL